MSKRLGVFLLRHGEPVGGQRIRGRRDDPLSELGWQQMYSSAEKVKADRVITSPLQRCQAFAQVWSKARGIPLQVDDDLQEIDMGHWEGLTYTDVFADDPLGYWRFQANPIRYMPPGGEGLQAAAERAGRLLTRLQALPEGEQVLLVAHAGIIRLLVALALGFPIQAAMRLKLPYACLLSLEGRQVDESWVWLLRWPS